MDINFNADPKELFNTEYLFIDGVSRSGKNGVAPIVCSFANVEHMNGNFNFDRLLPLLETGNITLSGFKYFFESDLLIDSWYRLMGRDLNMNKHDITSIVNSARFAEYKERLNVKDTEQTFKEIESRINNEKIIFPYCTEEMLPLANEHPSIFNKIKILLVLRHPIEMIFSWHRSKRGSRIGVDRRMPHPTFTVGKVRHIPSYAVEIAERFASEDPLGKCCLTIITMYNSYLESYPKCNIANKFIDFDDFAQNHESYIGMLETFTGTKRTAYTNEALEMARIPRTLNYDLFSIKTAAIFANSNPSLHDEIYKLSKSYEETFPSCPFRIAKPEEEEINKYKNVNFSDLTPQPAYVDGKRIN